MSPTPTLTRLRAGLFALVAMSFPVALSAQVTVLDFAGGSGTSSVDQYTGAAGGGWASAWQFSCGAGTTVNQQTVTDVAPLAGGGNYLSLAYDASGTGSSASQHVVVSRQIDAAAINLAEAVRYSFVIRPDSTVNNANQAVSVASRGSATYAAGATDTWRIDTTGSGWIIYDGTNSVTVGTLGASNLAGTAYGFDIVSDPTTKSWSVTITNLANGQTYESALLGWRSTAAVENEFLAFSSRSSSGTEVSGMGFSLDAISVASIPESAAVALLLGVGALGLASVGRRRRR